MAFHFQSQLEIDYHCNTWGEPLRGIWCLSHATELSISTVISHSVNCELLIRRPFIGKPTLTDCFFQCISSSFPFSCVWPSSSGSWVSVNQIRLPLLELLLWQWWSKIQNETSKRLYLYELSNLGYFVKTIENGLWRYSLHTIYKRTNQNPFLNPKSAIIQGRGTCL